MGTCGIAAGARETMKAVLDIIEKDSISGIIVSQTGCIGLCEREPIVQVTVGEVPESNIRKSDSRNCSKNYERACWSGKYCQGKCNSSLITHRQVNSLIEGSYNEVFSFSCFSLC